MLCFLLLFICSYIFCWELKAGRQAGKEVKGA